MKKSLLFSVLMLLMTWVCAVAQDRKVSGTVTSAEDGTGLPGVSVLLKGTSKGTQTDANGNYSIAVPASGGVLQFTSVGMNNQEVAIGSRSTVDVKLENDTKQLAEVVVTALGIQREKKALGYAVASVDKKALEQRPDGDVMRLLQGKAPGVDIGATSGLSGSGTNIIIRGVSSITGGSEPLFIVDGVQFNGNTNSQADFRYGNQQNSRFFDLDPNTIENISVLKGLSATTIYGEQGRNGVIVITTKGGSGAKGFNKKMEVQVNQSVFLNEIANLPDYQNEYGGGFHLSTGLTFFSNWGGKFGPEPIKVAHPYGRAALNAAFPQYIGATYDFKAYPTNVSDFFRKGIVNTTSVAVKGMAGNVTLNGSYSYLNDKGFTPGNDVNRNNISLGGVAPLSNKFTLNATVNMTLTDYKTPPNAASTGSGPAAGSGIFTDLIYTPRSVDLMGLEYYNPLDRSHVYYRPANDIQNPRWTVENVFSRQQTTRVFGNIGMSFDVSKSLNLMYKLGYDTYAERNSLAANKGGAGDYAQGFMRVQNINSLILDHNFIGVWNTNFGPDWTLRLDAGAQLVDRTLDKDGYSAAQQLVYGLLNSRNFVSINNRSEDGSFLNDNLRRQSFGVYAQGSFGFKDYLYLTVGGRNSWSSTLEAANRSLFYPSASVSFIPTSAIASLQNNKFLNYLKIRAGYASSANFPREYRTRPSLTISANTFVGADGTVINANSIPNRLPNPNLKPELITEFETGVEAKLWNNRISIDLTYYDKTANEQILSQDLDPATGYTIREINAGSVSNKGIELGVGVDLIRAKNFNWRFDMNYFYNRSNVKLPDGVKQIVLDGYTNQGIFAENNEPLGIIKGSYIVRDANGNRTVDNGGQYIISPDIRKIGDPTPDFKSTFINTLTWKDLSFRVQFDWTQGGQIFSQTARTLLARGLTTDTSFDRAMSLVLPGVKADGTPNDIQLPPTTAYFNVLGFGASELSVYDATIYRLREMSLSYSLPKSLVNKTKFGGISITFSGQNLWYNAPNIPKGTRFDTDSNGLGVGSWRGMEFIAGPTSRRYGVSLNFSF
jgi:TonB-linked SusC/RagA family outer membrane protein